MTEARAASREQLDRFSKDFEELTARLGRLVVGLSQQQFFWKPDTRVWSVAEVIEHLNVAAEQYLDGLKAAVANAAANPNADARRFFDRWLQKGVASMEPPPKRRFPAPKLFRPNVGPAEKRTVTQKEILERFVQIHQTIAKFLRELNDDRQLFAARVRSPAMPLVSMLLGQTFELVLVHARRHFFQLDKLKQQTEFPKL